MKVQSVILGGLLALGLAAGAQAQSGDLVDGSSVDLILDIAQQHGDAELTTQTSDDARKDGNPKIRGKVDGLSYVVDFRNCDENHEGCDDLRFFLGFTEPAADAELVNAWNRDKRWSKAYIDEDDDMVVTMDLNLEYGVSADNFDVTFQLWTLIMADFANYVGYTPTED